MAVDRSPTTPAPPAGGRKKTPQLDPGPAERSDNLSATMMKEMLMDMENRIRGDNAGLREAVEHTAGQVSELEKRMKKNEDDLS